MSPLDPNLQYLLISLCILFIITLGMGLAATDPSDWTGTQKAALTCYSKRLCLLGMLAPLYGKTYSPSWEANGFLNLS
jgi:hypothetical protein